jgi:DNA end-binding protein Ku
MAARSIGSGTISFGLVSIPVKLYTAASPQSVSFNLLHKKCGGRMKQQYYCPVDDQIVGRDEMVKGFEYSKDRYVQLSDDELKKVEAERSDQLEIVEFVPDQSVDLLYIEKTYYLGPDKGGDRAYKLLSDAMTRTGTIAVGRYWTRGKEQLVLVRPYKGGLVLHQVYYSDEVRSFDDVERPSQNVAFKPIEEELADKLIEQLAVAAFQPEQYHDEYRDRVMAAIEQKAAGEEVSVAPEQPQAQIIDLFEALKRSLGGAAKAPANNEEKAATEESQESSEEAKKPLTKTGGRRAREKKEAAG